jgi:membrane protein involved in colicin uptake
VGEFNAKAQRGKGASAGLGMITAEYAEYAEKGKPQIAARLIDRKSFNSHDLAIHDLPSCHGLLPCIPRIPQLLPSATNA